MPAALSYPGVYIEEISSGVRPIAGVATSITAFIGRTVRGPTNEPIRVNNFGDFERRFGGIEYSYPLSYAVQQFFLNGGTDAVIVRIANVGVNGDAVKSKTNGNGLPLRARGEGAWGNQVQVRIDLKTRTLNSTTEFNLFVRDEKTGFVESFRNLSVDPENSRHFRSVLEEGSTLVEFDDAETLPSGQPTAHADLEKPSDNPWDPAKPDNFSYLADGADGGPIDPDDIKGNEVAKTGIYALEKVDLFNLLCIPPLGRESEVTADIYSEAAKYCERRRAMLLVDAPKDAVTVEDGEKIITSDVFDQIGTKKNAAIYFPWIKSPDPKKENRLQAFAPCGAVAGIMARTDLQRGVWKSPAGLEATLVGVSDFTFKMTDQENGRLNILGINCLRNFRGVGNVVWGARTLEGSEQLGSEWKYLAVRRFTLYLEESLYRGTQWVVFEPNDEPLWAQIRLNIGAFMQNLFRQGAFQGRSPREAYFVRCGADTTNQNDINRGIVNIEVGFAPLKPAEFVVIKFQQITGKIDT